MPAPRTPPYVLEITMPASTLITAPTRDTVTLDRAVEIVAVTVHVPSGHKGLTHFRLELDRAAVVPSNDGRYFTLDNTTQRFPVGLVLDKRSELALVGYNEDDTYAHSIRVVIETKNPE